MAKRLMPATAKSVRSAVADEDRSTPEVEEHHNAQQRLMGSRLGFR
ncbi:MAG: hypothetical protein AAF671_08345 [Pseudomonadota bacterium]